MSEKFEVAESPGEKTPKSVEKLVLEEQQTQSTSEKFKVAESPGEKTPKSEGSSVLEKLNVREIRCWRNSGKFEVAESLGEKTPSQKKTWCWRNSMSEKLVVGKIRGWRTPGEKTPIRRKLTVGLEKLEVEVSESSEEKTPCQRKTRCWRNSKLSVRESRRWRFGIKFHVRKLQVKGKFNVEKFDVGESPSQKIPSPRKT